MATPAHIIVDPGPPKNAPPDAVLRCLVWTRRDGWIVAWRCCGCEKMNAIDHPRAPIPPCLCGHQLCVAPRSPASPLAALGEGLGRGLIAGLREPPRSSPPQKGRRRR